ncbi:MAG: flagellar assembly peptidoglycan hydrolase FlgJ [Solimonas sp.]
MTLRPDTITDFGQFTGMRVAARSGDEATVKKAAQQFEALFTQQMLKSARAASLGKDVMGGGQTDFYQDIFDQQMAVHLSSGKGLGLADLLVQQLRGGTRADSTVTPPLATDAAARAPSVQAAQAGKSGNDGDDRATFVQAIRPHAERAARELGVPARVLIAQAALETGWGRHAIRGADGQSAHNYFGVKADARWQGADVQTTTTEYVDGQAQRGQAGFRRYDDAGQAFDNYVDFLKSNPRYADALRHGGNAAHFVQGLQKAGYATDPAYAQKILRIADGHTMQQALAAPTPLSA